MEPKKYDRRQFMNVIRKNAPAIVLGGILVADTVRKEKAKNHPRTINDRIDPKPVMSYSNSVPHNDILKPHVFSRNINSTEHLFLGVEHTRAFAEEYYNTLDSFVKNSKYVVLEAKPLDMERLDVTNNGKAYFGTLFELCKKYNKTAIYTDSLSIELLEAGTWITGGLAFGLWKQSKKESRNRREFIKNASITVGLTYLLLGTPTGALIRTLMEPDNSMKGKNNARYINHLLDQRNVRITKNIQKISKTLPQQYQKGDYVLASYGMVHTQGIEYYIDHPNVLELKQAIYAVSINPFDNNIIIKYDWQNNKWKEEILKI